MSPIITLLSDTMPELLPMQNRSPGLHLSDVINDLSIIQGHYQPSPLNMARLQLGNTFEWAFINRLRLDDPERYWQCGELPGFGGLPVTPDLVDKHYWRPQEFKCTWESLRHVATAEQVLTAQSFWKRWTQLAYQALALGSTEGVLPVLHINGDYSYDAETGGPQYREWHCKWSKQELIQNRDKLLSHRDTMIREGRIGR